MYHPDASKQRITRVSGRSTLPPPGSGVQGSVTPRGAVRSFRRPTAGGYRSARPDLNFRIFLLVHSPHAYGKISLVHHQTARFIGWHRESESLGRLAGAGDIKQGAVDNITP
jgi:hypothetical protein